MKFYVYILFLLTTFISQISYCSFPQKPIKLIVYTKPGGAIDVFARKFQGIAKKYTKTPFVVINKPGAGGIIALKYLQSTRPDGYTLAAVTKSNIGKFVSSNSEIKIDDFNWIAMLVSDPEAIIVNRNSSVPTWNDIIKDAKYKNGAQLWLGPDTGGNDHIMALKTWKAAGIQAKWVPFSGGGKAMAALMGKHGSVYVGNPGDVLGKPDLKVVAISSTKRLEKPFSNVPTFSELGIKNLDEEIIWRGFITGKEIPKEAEAFYLDLFKKVNQDPEWKAYISKNGANPVFYQKDKFLKIVKNDRDEFEKILRDLKIIN